MRKDILEQRKLIEQRVSEGIPKVEIARELNCKVDTLTSYLKKMGIEYSGNIGRKRLSHDYHYIPATNYLFNGSTIHSSRLKEKLIKDGLKKHECEICNLTEWNGIPIPLELDHIDGEHFNNELSNLRVLCPNCHAQTTTYCKKKTSR